MGVLKEGATQGGGGGGGGSVESVTGNIVNNGDSANPVVTQVNADWNETLGTSPAFILNKPTIPSGAGYYDAVVDGTTYSTVGAAITAGAATIKVTIDTIEATDITLTQSVWIDVYNDKIVHFDGVRVENGAFNYIQRQTANTDSPSIKYTQTNPDLPLFHTGSATSIVDLTGCGIDFGDVTGDNSSLCEDSIIVINQAYFTVGNASRAGFTPKVDRSGASGALLIGGGTNTAYPLSLQGATCVISDLIINRGLSTQAPIYEVVFGKVNGLTIYSDTISSTAKCGGITNGLTLLGSSDLDIEMQDFGELYGPVNLNAGTISSATNTLNVVIDSVRTSTNLTNDSTDGNWKVNNCEIGGTSLLESPTTQITNSTFLASLEVDGTDNFLFNVTAQALVVGGTGTKVIGCNANVLFTDNAGDTVRAGNSGEITNNYTPTTGTHSTTWQGPFTTPSSGDVDYQLLNGEVTLQFPLVSGVATISNQLITATTFLPASLRPTVDKFFPVLITNSGTSIVGICRILTTGAVQFWAGSTNASFFANTGAPGFYPTTIKYKL